MDDDNRTEDELLEAKPGSVIKYDLSEQMRKSYIEYAMSVIISRALPDARDGLKPVHRRILYGMWDMGIRHNTANKKCARIVGDVLGKYHPHGDASVYDALVRLGQDFSLRYPVIIPQGNFGSIDGDPAAAMRYTEARMAKIGEEMLADIQKDTVDWMGNYDESLMEPVVLPAAFPFLICNGTSGIAVGMATNMAPHNLSEVVEAIRSLIDNPDISDDELMKIVKGPDFPSGAIIHGVKGIREAYTTGKGKIVIRSKYEIAEADEHSKDFLNKHHTAIYFTELPYQVNKAELVKKIDDLRKDKEHGIPGIEQVKDLSGRDGLRVAVYLKQGAVANIVLNMLFQRTQLQSNFNIYNLALYENKPKLFTLRELLQVYIDHRENVIERRTRYDRAKAKEREHILLGLKIGLDNIDEVIKIIKEAESEEVAAKELEARFSLDSIQSDAIIKMRLGRLSHLETEKILTELKEIEERIKEYDTILSSRENVLSVVKEEILKIGETYGDERRTEIVEREIEDVNPGDLIKKEDVVVVVSKKGFVKRLPVEEYKAQNKGGKGVIGTKLVDGDEVKEILTCNSHDTFFIVTAIKKKDDAKEDERNVGKAYYLKTFDIPEGSKTARGAAILKSLINIEEGEVPTSIITFSDFKDLDENESLLMVTKKGIAKRVNLKEFRNAKIKGVKAIILDDDDELVKAIFVKDDDEVMLITKSGKGLRTSVKDIRLMGRNTHGVKAMRLLGDDEIVGLVKVEEGKDVFLATSSGKGKRISFSDFSSHGRNTMGQRAYGLREGDYLVNAFAADDNNDAIFMTQNGQVIRIHLKNVRAMGRGAGGVIVTRFKEVKGKESDRVKAFSIIDYQEDAETASVEEEPESE